MIETQTSQTVFEKKNQPHNYKLFYDSIIMFEHSRNVKKKNTNLKSSVIFVH